MQELGLAARRPRRLIVTTKSEKGARVAVHLLQRDFQAAHPNQKWSTDTTYIGRQDGWLVLVGVFDFTAYESHRV
jgi:putative transposase